MKSFFSTLTFVLLGNLIGAVELTIIGDLPGGRRSASARGVNADGSIVCGAAEVTVDPGGANEETVTGGFVWTLEGGMVLLPFPQDTPGRRRAVARGISDDGSRIVGEARNFFGKDEPALWTRQADGTYVIELLSPPSGSSFLANVSANLDALGISGNGTVVCGRGQTIPGEFEAWRWTRTDGLQPIGNLSGPLVKSGRTSYSSAMALSGDGSRIIGRSWTGVTASGGVTREGFLFEDSVMTALGDLQTPALSSEAYAISQDGSTVVGRARDPEYGSVAFRKIGGSPMMSLGILPATAFAVSADGSVASGCATTAIGREAFVWTQSGGMALLSEEVTIPNGRLEEALAISDDGLTIVGTIIYPGENGQNDREAFLLVREGVEFDLGTLVDQVDLTVEIVGGSIRLAMTSPPEGVVYTLEYSRDLETAFTAQVEFTPAGREVRDLSYHGISLTMTPPSEEIPADETGFWRVRLSQP